MALLWPQAGEWETVETKVASALDLIALYTPIRFRRLLGDAEGLWIFGEVGPLGVWQYQERVIRLRLTYCTDHQVTPALLACTIVHEATHAYLWRLGFRYPETQRAQIERICTRSERVFLRRVPGEEDLLRWKQSLPDPAPERYTQQAFQRGARQQLRELNTPRWAMRLLGVQRDEQAAEQGVAGDVRPGIAPE